MVREFKKTGVAVALTGALLATAAMNSQATVQLSAPGDVMLVPYVVCDTGDNRKNTMVGLITFWKERLGLISSVGTYMPAPTVLANVVPPATSKPQLPQRIADKASSFRKGNIHWYFYDKESKHKASGILPVTDNDFVRFDWCDIVVNDPAGKSLNGVEGYLLFVDDFFDSAQFGSDQNIVGMPRFALYGHSYQIKGEWASQAFIPVLTVPVCTYNSATPVVGGDCTETQSDSTHWLNAAKKDLGAGFYPHITRLVSGTDFVQTSGTVQDIYVRYFLDPALASENRFVFWFNNVSSGRTAAGESYNSEQVYQRNFSQPLPYELNVVVSTPTDPKILGLIHEEKELSTGVTVKNTGIIRFGIPEYSSTIPYTSSGVSFNMLGLKSSENQSQFQTEMTTEGAEF